MTGWPFQDPTTVETPSLAESILRAESTELHLRELGQLRAAADELLATIDALGCFDVVAASRAAEPLVTAAAMLADGRVAMHGVHGAIAEKVVLVDAATITGNGTRNCAHDLRAKGAQWVAAVVYDRVRPDLDGLDEDSVFDAFQVLGAGA